MAVPALPSDDSDGNDWTAAKVNAIYDHIGWWRDSRPVLFVARTLTAGTGTSTQTNIPFSDESSNFNTAPGVNTGGWVASGATGNGGVLVPETGLYQVTLTVEWANTDLDGDRAAFITDGGATIVGGVDRRRGSVGLDSVNHITRLRSFTANDEVGGECWQNSGSSLNTTGYLQCIWVQSV